MDWLRDHMWETWMGLAILLGVAELFSLDLILLMRAVGAVVGGIAALIGLPVAVQILGAVAASVAMLSVVRPSVVKRLHSGPSLVTGHGQMATATLSRSVGAPRFCRDDSAKCQRMPLWRRA